MSDITPCSVYWSNNSDKFKYNYYSATWYDKDNDDYDTIYFCVPQKRYIVYTDKDIYEFSKDDTILMLDNETVKEIYVTDVSIGMLISLCFEDEWEEVTEIEVIE